MKRKSLARQCASGVTWIFAEVGKFLFKPLEHFSRWDSDAFVCLCVIQFFLTWSAIFPIHSTHFIYAILRRAVAAVPPNACRGGATRSMWPCGFPVCCETAWTGKLLKHQVQSAWSNFQWTRRKNVHLTDCDLLLCCVFAGAEELRTREYN